MEYIVCTEAVPSCVAQGGLLNESLEFHCVWPRQSKKFTAFQIVFKCGKSNGSLCRAHRWMSSLPAQPNRDFESIYEFHPVKPSDRDRFRIAGLCFLQKLIGFFAFG